MSNPNYDPSAPGTMTAAELEARRLGEEPHWPPRADAKPEPPAPTAPLVVNDGSEPPAEPAPALPPVEKTSAEETPTP